MIKHFHRYLSNIPRWSLLPLHHKQNVAEHSFYVTLYMRGLLSLKSFGHMDDQWKLAALNYALIHDMTEARTSDIPGPVKRSIKDPAKYEDFEAHIASTVGLLNHLGQSPYVDDKIRRLVKVADLTEEILFLTMERVSGNGHASRVAMDVRIRFTSAVASSPLTVDDCELWMSWVAETIRNLEGGVETPSNSDDLTIVNLFDEEVPF